jgi:hypothetical protein
MGGEKPFPIPMISWFAPGVMEMVTPGHGLSAQGAFDDMTGHCPMQDTIAFTYTCASAPACTVNQSGDASSCPYTITVTSLTPPYGVTVLGPSMGGSNKITSTGQCMKKLQAGRFSHWGSFYQGLPFGDATHDSMGVMNSRAPAVAAFRQ